MALNLQVIEIVTVKPEITNPNKIHFTSLNRFEPLRFVNNSLDLGNHSEESDLREDFKRTLMNSQQNSIYITKRRKSKNIFQSSNNSK